MNRIKGDIWSFRDAWIVIPTNLEGVCGRGLARQMIDRFPGVGEALRREGKAGQLTQKWESAQFLQFYTPEVAQQPQPQGFYRLVPFPVKRHWRDEASITMIQRSCQMLVALLQYVTNPYLCVIPQVGCGFGELRPEDVLPMVHCLMQPVGDRALLIEPDPEVFGKYPKAFRPGAREDRSVVLANQPPEAGGFGNMGGFPDLDPNRFK